MPGAEDHAGDGEGKGRDAGTEPVRGAAQHLHPGLKDAEQGMEDRGAEDEDSNGWHAGQGEVAKRSVARAPLVPCCGEVHCLSGATSGAARGLARCRAPVPRDTAEVDGSSPAGPDPFCRGLAGAARASRKRLLMTLARAST